MPGTIPLGPCLPGVAVDRSPEAIDRDSGVAGVQAAVDPPAINRSLGTSRPPSASSPVTHLHRHLRRYGQPPRFESREHIVRVGLVDDRDPVIDIGDARRGPRDGDGVIAFGAGADRP